MSIAKACADRLRQNYVAASGARLRSGHAHELTAAFFGYRTAAALRAEQAYPLDNIEDAQVLIPDLAMMDRRRRDLEGLPDDLADSDGLARQLVAFLESERYFVGKAWFTREIKILFRGRVSARQFFDLHRRTFRRNGFDQRGIRRTDGG